MQLKRLLKAVGDSWGIKRAGKTRPVLTGSAKGKVKRNLSGMPLKKTGASMATETGKTGT
jgi:hypothetical protein